MVALLADLWQLTPSERVEIASFLAEASERRLGESQSG
jgi:hypothetical protein